MAERSFSGLPNMPNAQSVPDHRRSGERVFSSCKPVHGASVQQLVIAAGAPLVYFLRCGEADLLKIGVTTRLEDRIADLQIGCPFALNLLVTAPGGMMTERALHTHFSEYWERGEWFRYAGHLRATVESLLAGGAMPDLGLDNGRARTVLTPLVTYCGAERTVREWCRRLRLDLAVVLELLGAGATIEAAFLEERAQVPYTEREVARWERSLSLKWLKEAKRAA